MTQRGEGGPGDPVGSGTSAALPAAGDSSPWAPLAQRAFRWLWLGMLFSWIGTWMQTVGAQWLLVDDPNAAVLVSLVQAATTLPLMLLALPGGVLADSFDRRRLLLTVQAYLVVLGVLLTAFTAAGLMPPALLLAFTLALGVGAAVQLPTWQAMMPELVPRTQLRAATGLDAVSVNGARSIGPALAGLVIAYLGGVPVVFALYAVCAAVFAVAVFFWRGPDADSRGPPGAFRAGPARRGPLRLARTRGAPHPASGGRVCHARDGAVGAAAADRQPAPGARGGRLWRSVRRLRRRRHRWCRRAATSERPPVHQRAPDGSRTAVCGSLGVDRAHPRPTGGPDDPGARRAGVDGRGLHARRRAAAVPAGLGPRPWPRDLHGRLHRVHDGRSPRSGGWPRRGSACGQRSFCQPWCCWPA